MKTSKLHKTRYMESHTHDTAITCLMTKSSPHHSHHQIQPQLQPSDSVFSIAQYSLCNPFTPTSNPRLIPSQYTTNTTRILSKYGYNTIDVFIERKHAPSQPQDQLIAPVQPPHPRVADSRLQRHEHPKKAVGQRGGKWVKMGNAVSAEIYSGWSFSSARRARN